MKDSVSIVALILFLTLENGDSGQTLLDKQYSLAQLWWWVLEVSELESPGDVAWEEMRIIRVEMKEFPKTA